MADFKLYSRSAFGRAEPVVETWDGFEIREISERALASVSLRQGKTEDLNAAVQSAFGFRPPKSGRNASNNGVTFDWMGQGQWFVSAAREDGTAFARELVDALGESASVTDQSDAWMQLELSGNNSRLVLEKLCPLDLHPTVFTTGSVARTVMEHIGAIICLLDDSPRFKLLTARSSARSFLHALQQAADSTCGHSVGSK